MTQFELTPEEAVEFQQALLNPYADKDSDLWIQRPDDYWVFLDCRCGEHPWDFDLAQLEWKTGENTSLHNRTFEAVSQRWGPLYASPFLIEEQP